MADSDDRDDPEKRAPSAEELILAQPVEAAPPPPGNVQSTSTQLNIALMQNPDTIAHLPPALQSRVFDGIDADNVRQFELAKMQLEMNERSRNASIAERQEIRKSSLDDRKNMRSIVVLFTGTSGLIATGVYVYLLATGRDAAAAVFLSDVIKIAGGALGGGGATALYKGGRDRRP